MKTKEYHFFVFFCKRTNKIQGSAKRALKTFRKQPSNSPIAKKKKKNFKNRCDWIICQVPRFELSNCNGEFKDREFSKCNISMYSTVSHADVAFFDARSSAR